MAAHYEVMVCDDDTTDLQHLLKTVDEVGGEVISVIWQPERELTRDHRAEHKPITKPSGFVVVYRVMR